MTDFAFPPAALAGVEVERLERWAVVLDEGVAPRDAPPHAHDVRAPGEIERSRIRQPLVRIDHHSNVRTYAFPHFGEAFQIGCGVA